VETAVYPKRNNSSVIEGGFRFQVRVDLGIEEGYRMSDPRDRCFLKTIERAR
jgi:hypothetical protein